MDEELLCEECRVCWRGEGAMLCGCGLPCVGDEVGRVSVQSEGVCVP